MIHSSSMTLTTVTGRVRATVRLPTAGGPRVVEGSWASDRAFPRTRGAAVPFELETGDGAVYRVEPFAALVVLPVRGVDARDGVRREDSWIAAGDEITIEGEVERGGRGRGVPLLRARRIAAASPSASGAVHRMPPGAVQAAQGERIEVAPPPVTTVATVSVGGGGGGDAEATPSPERARAPRRGVRPPRS
jgi:hypothetical protein